MHEVARSVNLRHPSGSRVRWEHPARPWTARISSSISSAVSRSAGPHSPDGPLRRRMTRLFVSIKVMGQIAGGRASSRPWPLSVQQSIRIGGREMTRARTRFDV